MSISNILLRIGAAWGNKGAQQTLYIRSLPTDKLVQVRNVFRYRYETVPAAPGKPPMTSPPGSQQAMLPPYRPLTVSNQPPAPGLEKGGSWLHDSWLARGGAQPRADSTARPAAPCAGPEAYSLDPIQQRKCVDRIGGKTETPAPTGDTPGPADPGATVAGRAACPFGEFEPPLQVEGVVTALNVSPVKAMKQREISFESAACPGKLDLTASCEAPATPTKPIPPPKPLALMNRSKAGIRPAATLLDASHDISRAGGKVAGLSARDQAMADALLKALSLRAPDESVDEFYARVGKATCAPEFPGDADSGGAGTAVVPRTANQSFRTLRLPSDLLAAIRNVKRQAPATAAPGLSSHPVTKIRREDSIEKALKRVFAEKGIAPVSRQDSDDSGVASHDETSTGDWEA